MKKTVLSAVLCAAMISFTAGCADSTGANDVPQESSNISSEDPGAANAADPHSSGLDDALNVALNHAGLTEDQITLIRTKLQRDNGVDEYEIEFTANGMRYEYEINAQSGDIIEFSAEKFPAENSNSGTQTSEKLTESEAKSIAVKHAGFSENQVSFIKSKLDFDNGVQHYEIEFTANGTRYEYEINAQSGDIIEFSAEKIPTGNTNLGNTNPGNTNSGNSNPENSNSGTQTSEKITESEAKSIALKHAGFSENQVSFIKSKLDYDDGVQHYEIEFTANGTRYEYEINAQSGAIIEFSAEKIPTGNSNPGTQTSEKITESQAKSIAVKHAGFSESQVIFIKAKLEYEHGIWEYEIEFITDTYEYEYKINGVTGAVIEWESEHHSEHHH